MPGDEYLAQIRHQMHPDFMNRPAHDLSSLNLFVVVQRPADQQP